MSLRSRRVIYLSFISAFIIGAPLILLYATGYRYQASHQRLNATGTLVVSSMPAGATISLNGQRLNNVTPRTVHALPPGLYDIILNKEGYRPWRKRLPISAGQAVFASNVRLWRESLPALITEGKFEAIALDRNGKQLLISTASESGQHNISLLTNEHLTSLATVSSETPLSLEWAPDGTRALAYGNTKSYVISLTMSNSPKELPANLTDYRWGTNNATIFARDERSIYQLTMDTDRIQSRIIATIGEGEKIADFWISGSTIFLTIIRPAATSMLRTVNLSDGVVRREIVLAGRAPHRRLASDKNTVVLRDSAGLATVWNLDAATPWHLTAAADVSEATIELTSGHILYATSFELWTYDPTHGERELLLRLSDKVTAIKWYTNATHAFFATSNGLSTVERDHRDRRNIWTLAPVTDLVDYAISPDGEFAYISGVVGGRSGLWRLEF